MFREDGYINATKVAKEFEKKLDNFWRLVGTMDYIHFLDKFLIPSDSRELIIAKKGRHGGTWLHPKLAVKFARWLSVEFEVWCDLMIDNILQGNIQTSVVGIAMYPQYDSE